MLFEICIDSVEGAILAQQGGAQRVELCDNLIEGGTTPSLGMLQLTCQKVSIDVNVMIRPRGGDFCYTDLEYEVMRLDIEAAKRAGAQGVVLGILLPNGRVDIERTSQLAVLARPMSVTFHRAFDLCSNPLEALHTLIELGIDRILTSGQKPNVLEGLECIAYLVQQAKEQIMIMAGGGVNEDTLPIIVKETGVKEVHFSARQEINSPMFFHNSSVTMGKAYQPDEYRRKVTDAERVRTIICSLNQSINN